MDDSYQYYIEQAVTYGASIVGALIILIVGWIAAPVRVSHSNGAQSVWLTKHHTLI